jgi:replication-associated recombination protein RarA
VQEFERIMNDDNVKIMLLTGPPGCGKNSLIDVYCKDNNIELMRYTDGEESKYAELDRDELVYREESYPKDLENFIEFIKQLAGKVA